MVSYNDLIKRLLAAEGRGQRGILSEAAEAIEELEQKFNSLLADTKKAVDDMDGCRICANEATPALCAIGHNDCRTCTADCVCKDCDRGEKWEWRGLLKEAPASEDVMACQKCGEPAPYSQFFGGYVCPCGYVTRKEG